MTVVPGTRQCATHTAEGNQEGSDKAKEEKGAVRIIAIRKQQHGLSTGDTLDDWCQEHDLHFQIGAGLYAVGRPVQKRNDEDGQIGTIQSLPLERGALFNRFFGEPAHGPPHVAGGASGPIGGCRDESRTDNPDLDLRHVFDRNNRKTDLI